jgi:hypothetical protein
MDQFVGDGRPGEGAIMSQKPTKRGSVRIIIQQWDNGTYSATENGVDVRGYGDTAHEAVREYTRQVENL